MHAPLSEHLTIRAGCDSTPLIETLQRITIRVMAERRWLQPLFVSGRNRAQGSQRAKLMPVEQPGCLHSFPRLLQSVRSFSIGICAVLLVAVNPDRIQASADSDATLPGTLLVDNPATRATRTQIDEAFLAGFGLEYQLKKLSSPRPNRVHILRVDLLKGRVEPAVIVAPDPDGDGPAEAALTDPLKLAAGRQTLAFINTNPWDSLPDATGKKNRKWFAGQAVDINGLAVAAGIERSPKGKECLPVRMTAQGMVMIGAEGADAPAGEGMAGFQQIVKAGKLVAPPSDALAPRTALGINRDSSLLWLVVVDGRQGEYSGGMSCHEMGACMLELGCWNAVNMDGGGSSVMGLAAPDGKLHVVNSPSDSILNFHFLRPLPMILTLQKAASEKKAPQ
ncbi:MAG: phosphodiester glycosidase family protein [bacterium]